jgi:hypothetical protein
MIYKASWKQFRWTLSRGNICSTDAVQRLPSTPNSLKLQEQRKAFSPIRKVRAISQKLYSHSKPPNPPRHTSRGFLHWRFAHPGPGTRGAVSVGPASANLHNRYRNGYPPDVRFSLRTDVVGPPLHILKVPQQQSHALQQRAELFDRLVGDGKQRRRDAETTSTECHLRLMRRTKTAASQVPVNDLIGPVSMVGGTPFCGVPIKLRATYGITVRDGDALDEQRKFVTGLP